MSNTPSLRIKGKNSDWSRESLSELVSFAKGKGYSRNDIRDEGAPLMLYGRMYTDYQFEISDVDTFAVPVPNSKISTGNEVVIPASGESAEDISRAAAILTPGIILGGDLNILTPDASLNPSFLALAISNGKSQKELSSKAQGKTVVHLHNSDIQELTIDYPDEKEQLQIKHYFTTIDRLITLHQRKLDTLLSVRKSMLQKMFPRNGSKVPEIRFKGFEGEWEEKSFGTLFHERRDKTAVEYEDTLLSCAIDGMYLNSELFDHFRGSSTIGYLKVKKNDLILSAQNLHLGNANVNLRFDSGIISPAYKVYDIVDSDPLFIQTWVKQEDTKRFFLAATTEGASVCRKNIEWDVLDQQLIMIPSKAEQVKIGEYFGSIDALVVAIQRKIVNLKRIKHSLLARMFV